MMSTIKPNEEIPPKASFRSGNATTFNSEIAPVPMQYSFDILDEEDIDLREKMNEISEVVQSIDIEDVIEEMLTSTIESEEEI